MARTKGAKDNRPRKRPQPKISKGPSQPANSQGRTAPPVERATPAATATGTSPTAVTSPPVRAAIPPTEFEAAIAAELGRADGSSPTPGPCAADTEPAGPPPAQATSFEPSTLTIEGLEAAFQAPFFLLSRVLAWLRIAPDPEPIRALGKRRAKVLAKPAYAVYEHYARQYLGLHPDNRVHVAIGVTGLNTIGISPELVEAIEESRRRAGLRASPQATSSSPPAGT